MSVTDSGTAKLFLVAHAVLTRLAESSGRCNNAKRQQAADAILNAMARFTIIKASSQRVQAPDAQYFHTTLV